ncbi:hypothetical protein ACIBSW_12140 [Actinoplanes sp. NPDC049668]|uniref:hypothetical protein n=1 Tax=unclassified Actinoplanes TaxID=2626549 RepID=UPI0033B4D4F1
MSSLLEDRYRLVLRMLPSDYRQAWEEDMVASFMQAAYAAAPDDAEGVEISRPSLAETASIAVLAVRVRLGGTGAAPRSFVWGEAVRRIALIGLLAHAIGALVGVVYLIWAFEQLGGVIPLTDGRPMFATLWEALWRLAGLLWIPAYLSAVHGHHRAARILAVIAFLPMMVNSVMSMTGGPSGFSLTTVYGLLFGALPILAMAAFGPDSPCVSARPWLIALPVGVVAVVAATSAFGLAAQSEADQGELLALTALTDKAGLWCAGLTGAAVVHLIIEHRRPRRIPVWPLALALLVPPVLLLRVITLVHDLRLTGTTDIALTVTIGAVQCAALVVTGAMLARIAARRLRHLPTAAEPAPGQTAPTVT